MELLDIIHWLVISTIKTGQICGRPGNATHTPVSPPHTTAQLSRARALAPNRHVHELLLLILQSELVSLHWVRVQAAIALLQPKLFLLRGFVDYNFVDSP